MLENNDDEFENFNNDFSQSENESDNDASLNMDDSLNISDDLINMTNDLNLEAENDSTDSTSDTPSSDVSMDDIFSNIPPMPADFEDPFEKAAANRNDNDTVTVQPVRFASFDESKNLSGDAAKNLDNLLDIKLQLTVELGRTTLPVKKVLELTRGSIVELDKIAGEPVELYANGKLIAHGEVVVIEDNFGLRITNMSEPENRLNSLK